MITANISRRGHCIIKIGLASFHFKVSFWSDCISCTSNSRIRLREINGSSEWKSFAFDGRPHSRRRSRRYGRRSAWPGYVSSSSKLSTWHCCFLHLKIVACAMIRRKVGSTRVILSIGAVTDQVSRKSFISSFEGDGTV